MFLSGEVLGDELSHLKHRDGLLAVEHLLEILIGVDVALVLLILKAFLLDVYPELLDDLRAGHRALDNDRSQIGANSHRLHELIIFFFMKRRPKRSTLFPYTTLFRPDGGP